MRLVDFTRGAVQEREARAAYSTMFETWKSGEERLLTDFRTYASEGYSGNAPVFSLISFRVRTISEIEFKYQNLSDKRLFGGPGLLVLERPQPTWSTSDLIGWLELDVNIAGNAYVLREGGTMRRLRPDWVRVAINPADGFVAGYVYHPNNGANGEGAIVYSVGEVAHYMLDPDPLASHRGQSWLTPVAREVDADTFMSKHKLKFFTNAATPNLLVKVEGQLTADSREKLREEFAKKYASWENAYRTAILDGGADVTVIGNTFQEMAFTATQGAGETRLANAAGVPPIAVGFSKGLDAATYSNYHQAMRAYADTRARPNWRHLSQSLEPLVDVPAGARLWYDDRHIAFLQQDAKDEADIRKAQAATINSLISSGYTPESCIEAVMSGDFRSLVHTGLYTVQLQAPGAGEPKPANNDGEEDNES
jgi:HK97 family phage portal protein